MDIEILLFLQRIREALGGSLNSFLVFISGIGVDYYVIVPMLIIFWTIDKKKGARIFATWGSCLWLGGFLKATFCIYRPWVRDARVQPPEEIFAGATGYSFPSGHSFSSGGFWNSVAMNYKENKALMKFCFTMVGLTMFSRIFLGVHTPQDVIVGCGISWVCIWLMGKVFDWVEKNPEKDWVIVLLATVLSVALLCYLKFKSYPMDYVDGKLLVDPKKMTIDGFKDPGMAYGIIVGWFLERRFVKFNVEGTTSQKLMRALAGGLITVFWYTAVAIPVGKAIGTSIGYFLTMASIPVLMMTVYPLVFTKIEGKNKE